MKLQTFHAECFNISVMHNIT